MSNIAIKFNNISKEYRLGLVSTRTLSHDLNRWWQTSIRHKEDPYLKIGETNDRTKKGESEYVWALRDIDFEVKKGDVLGIIGKNGAGKSTLLKILSRVTTPTTGTIEAEGRIASLLEVGTGFHPELTGRENIYMNGSIMGMTRKEIDRKLDEIVDFAGVERYIDTPAKRYSSGMTVRLGFAIAAHLDPEILVVDEVLAVGDAEFQKKAIGKMQDVSRGEGRTVLFVSHNMGAVRSLCKKGVVLKDGNIVFSAPANDAINHYIGTGYDNDIGAIYENSKLKATGINKIEVLDKNGRINNKFQFDEAVCLKFSLNIEKKYINMLLIGVKVRDQLRRNVFTTQVQLKSLIKKEGNHSIVMKIPAAILVPNKYTIIVGLHIPNQEMIINLEAPVQFSIEETGSDFFQYQGVDFGCVIVNCNWEII